MTITIVGLGPGGPAQLTREAWEVLSTAGEVYLRTARHPTVAGLPAGLAVHSFDEVYEQTGAFDQVYQTIAERVLALGRRPQGVVYAVPGHPMVAEATVQLIRARLAETGESPRIVAGLSFIEPVLAALNVDALPTLQLADALDLAAKHHPAFHPDAPALVAQLYSPLIAGDVKLTLMNQYPDDHRVALAHAVGTPEARVEWLPLFEIDRSPHIAHLTALYVPPLPVSSAMESLQEVVAHLRAPEGCPWDREQTHQTLRTNLLEETYEVLEAIDADDPDAMREEFGDLLLQVVLHAQIATEAGEYSLAEVIAEITAKLIRRHPHVFGDTKVSSVGEVLENWEKLKAQERGGQAKPDKGVLGTLPPGLPALLQAATYQRRAARVGFDWPDIGGVRAKVQEEIDEVEAVDAEDTAALEEEVGDLLFAAVNWARWLKVDAESALRMANEKFAGRFRHMEAAAQAAGRALDSYNLQELDALWEAAKAA
ncbi:MAG: nucleoside triphosphate pyrophosphohydrolase [Anaerolineales bacterium]|nr:nucleoside triphosphate pyrophosphohydrolase [Anaerolineales bacterium]